jgi:Uma2 family endonuclease
MQAIAERLLISTQEYIDGEPLADIRHEFIEGEIYAMAGAGDAHVKVTLNMALLLKSHLRGSGCSTYVADMKVRIADDDAFFYPDVMVTCDPEDQLPQQNYIKNTPKLIIEVLSPSTEVYDRGKKFILYRKLASLEEYVLINPREYYVELYRRRDHDSWLLFSFDKEDAMIEFKSVQMKCRLIDLYEDIVFSTAR